MLSPPIPEHDNPQQFLEDKIASHDVHGLWVDLSSKFHGPYCSD